MEYAVPIMSAAGAYGLSQTRLTPAAAAIVGGLGFVGLRRSAEMAFGIDYQSQESTWHGDETPRRGIKRSASLRGAQPAKRVKLTTHPVYSPQMPAFRKRSRSVRRSVKSWKKKATRVTKPHAFRGTASVTNPVHVRNERKLAHKLTAVTNYAATTSGSVTLLNGMVLGTTQNGDRIGRDIYCKDLFLQGRMYSNAAATNNLVRVIIAVDNSPEDTIPTIADLLNEAFSTASYNVDNIARWKILFDQSASLTGVTGADNSAKALSVHVPLNFATYFNTTNVATFDGIEKNAMYMFIVGSEIAGTGAAVVQTSIHLTYTAQ